ncbi:outer membrane biosynthesis protein TonB [Filimonas zeae]|uniref:Collagen-binding protein n=1 Tax=Filimonas zeae TaxID=1737353 RepID=A0A917IP69_9BACT|nr:carboxypeptidase-like regulatory domain-containing protein [Filimonas zeae]MDR6337232.1 outer membrane biosynthesis protein TonB [Filimonas zeae]GGH57622.1 collagen-binding protein [Filimonas zeae]
MGNVNLHINYTLADIQRYLSGKLSPGEMHEIEKAALLDPFLADALEGYSEAPLPQAAQHLNQIAASLQQPQDATNAVVTPVRNINVRWQWWKVAAMVIIIAGAGSLTWKLLQSPDGTTVPQHDLAQKQTTPAPAAPDPATQIAPQADSLKPAAPAKGSIAATHTVPPTKQANSQKPVPVPAPVAPPAKPAPEATLAQVTSEPPPSRMEAKAAPDLSAALAKKEAATANVVSALSGRAAGVSVSGTKRRKNAAAFRTDSIQATDQVVVTGYGINKTQADKATALALNETYKAGARTVAANLLRGTITDDSGNPVTGASVKVMNGNAVSITDDKGRFALRTLDTMAKVEITSIGFETRQAAVSISKNNTILLDTEEESLSDMVVTELRSRKKAPVPAEASADSVYPSGGWQSFQEYAYRKIHQEMDTTGSNQKITGTIELEFVIDEAGKPRDFNIIHSSDNSLNGKAISALQNGPVWIGDKKKKTRVKVRF